MVGCDFAQGNIRASRLLGKVAHMRHFTAHKRHLGTTAACMMLGLLPVAARAESQHLARGPNLGDAVTATILIRPATG
jgi:hypothetical protein